MVTCPACGIEADAAADACPQCYLSTSLFDSIREAAGPSGNADPTFLRTIGELLATVDLGTSLPRARASDPTTPGTSTPPVALAAAVRSPSPRVDSAIEPGLELPPAPSSSVPVTEFKRRLDEYFQLGRRFGLDFTDFESRANSAASVEDIDSLEILAREMFVHLSSSIAEEYESLLARRNELAPVMPTRSADVELIAVRRAIGVGDLGGAQRRLALVQDALAQVEEQWEVGRILVSEGDLMMTTIRDLGGDPTPAAGPLEEGRKLIGEGRRIEGERLLARAAVSLWTVLEPLLMTDLHRLRDRMVEERAGGLDIEPAVRELRGVATELKKRNFAGMVMAYRRLKFAVDGAAPPGGEPNASAELTVELRTSPSA
jgi:hypothetical protein